MRLERDSNPWPWPCSTNRAIKSTGSWSFFEFIIYPQIGKRDGSEYMQWSLICKFFHPQLKYMNFIHVPLMSAVIYNWTDPHQLWTLFVLCNNRDISWASLLAEVSHSKAKMRGGKERVSLPPLIFALPCETSASREFLSKHTLTTFLYLFIFIQIFRKASFKKEQR